MFTPDPDLVEKLSPHLERVLVVDPYEASAKVACELLRGLGAWRIEVADTSRRAFERVETWTPQLVITEFSAAGIDAPAFTKAIRRSSFAARRAPVIVASSQPKASEITAARDAGAHEFLRKPYSATDLRRRVENVACNTRPWIEAVAYVGPDRRRFNSGGYSGARRRGADRDVQRPQSAGQRFMQALAILSSAVRTYDTDPSQAVRSMQAQVEILSALALKLAEPRLVNTVSALDRYLASANQSGSRRLIQALLEDGANPLTDLAEVGAALDLDKAA